METEYVGHVCEDGDTQLACYKASQNLDIWIQILYPLPAPLLGYI